MVFSVFSEHSVSDFYFFYLLRRWIGMDKRARQNARGAPVRQFFCREFCYCWHFVHLFGCLESPESYVVKGLCLFRLLVSVDNYYLLRPFLHDVLDGFCKVLRGKCSSVKLEDFIIYIQSCVFFYQPCQLPCFVVFNIDSYL